MTHSAAVVHTYEVELAVNRARIAIEQTETTRRGYLLTGEPLPASYREYNRLLPAALAKLRALTLDNPGQQARVSVLQARIVELGQQREKTIRLIGAGQRDAAVAIFTAETSARRLRAIRDTFDAMTAEEQRLLALRDGRFRTARRCSFGCSA